MDDRGPFTVAITGGTGAFRCACGEAVVRRPPDVRGVYRLRIDTCKNRKFDDRKKVDLAATAFETDSGVGRKRHPFSAFEGLGPRVISADVVWAARAAGTEQPRRIARSGIEAVDRDRHRVDPGEHPVARRLDLV
jgi:hypothetical protein